MVGDRHGGGPLLDSHDRSASVMGRCRVRDGSSVGRGVSAHTCAGGTCRGRGGGGESVRSRRPGERGPGAPGHQSGPWAGPKPDGEAAKDCEQKAPRLGGRRLPCPCPRPGGQRQVGGRRLEQE